MQVQSFIQVGAELLPVEVELSLSPGLPQIHFLGLPDTAMRESALRIRSALRQQGFRLPRAHQILVHLKPTHLRKSSRGLDLAVAAALLWEMKQLPAPREAKPILYGELTLKGEVVQPDDIEAINGPLGDRVYTGRAERPLPFESYQLQYLKDLSEPLPARVQGVEPQWTRPEVQYEMFPTAAARVAEIIAAGEHSAVFAGPPGCGKSTLAESILCWLEAPRAGEDRVARAQARVSTEAWRPCVRPHHSTPAVSMIGGGGSAWAGEITRADGGLLILDEMLKFVPEVQDVLREPIEAGLISIARSGISRRYPARFLLIGTTNLCACGSYSPRNDEVGCRCPKYVRRRTITRLNGPFVDRFAIFTLTDAWNRWGDQVSSDHIQTRVLSAIQFRRGKRGQVRPNATLRGEDLAATLNDFQRDHILSSTNGSSRRRRDAVLRVARTCADLRGDELIRDQDLEEALHLCLRTYQLLQECTE